MKRFSKLLAGTIALLLVMVITACGQNKPLDGENNPKPNNLAGKGAQAAPLPKLDFTADDAELGQIAEANRRFALEWFDELIREESGNLIASPYSTSIALSMALRGSDGSTFEEMASIMYGGELEETKFHQQQASLLRRLYQQDGDITLLTANSIWHTDQAPASKSFLDELRTYYGADITEVNFEDSDTSKQINGWVQDKTMGKISGIVPEQIDPDTFMYLINALYLKAPWYEPFNKEMTAEEPFTLPSGEIVNVPMMKQNRTMQGIQEKQFKAVRLLLGEEAPLSMTLILPLEDTDWSQMRTAIQDAASWKERFKTYHVELALPKFKIEHQIDLIPSLESMGMQKLFSPMEADLGRMTDHQGPSLFIDEALQKTFIEIDEDGLEAAAVTAMRAYPTSMPEPMSAVFDRPFYFLIEDNATGTVLFIGAVRNPKQ